MAESGENGDAIRDRKIIQLAHHGKLDAKRLAKKLPEETLQGLRNGTIDPDQLAFSTMESFAATENAESSAEPAPVDSLISGIAMGVANDVVENGTEFYVEFMLDTRKLMKEKYHAAVSSHQEQRQSEEDLKKLLTRIAKDSFDESCTRWEPRIMTILYHGQPRGAFRRNCKLWGAPLREFRIFVDVIFKHNIDFDQVQEQTQGALNVLKQAGSDIAQGFVAIKSSCWECQSVPVSNKPLACCSKCKTACYCSSACQRIAWKSGHRAKCPQAQEKANQFRQMFREIDAMHKHQSDLHGILELSYMVDTKLVSSYFSIPMPIVTSADLMPDQLPPIKLLGPSMEILYGNLGKIVRGEWWMFNIPGTSLRKYKKKKRAALAEITKTNMMMYCMLAQLLMYDIISYAVAHKTDVPTMLFADGGISTTFMCPTLQLLLGIGGTPAIKASDFLDTYCSMASYKNNNRSTTKHFKAEATMVFRKESHK